MKIELSDNVDKKIDSIEPNKMLRRLRSDLLRAKLTKIEQIGTERIAYFTFTNFEKEFTLIVEFFGDGNIILCNEERKILALLHSIDVRHRQLRVGLEYAPPPEDGVDVLNLTKESFRELFSTSGIGKTIGRGLGLPKKYVEEIIRLSGIDPKKPSNEVTNEEFEALYEIITSTLSKVTQGPHDPSVIIEDDVHDAYPIRFSDDNLNAKKVDSFNEGLDIVFTEEILEKGKSLFSSPADKKIESLEKTLTEQKNAINVVLEKSKTIAEVANLLFTMTSAGQHDIRNEMITNSLKEKNAEIISEKGVPYMKINESKIQIDPDSSLPTIASKLFDESKKQKGAVKSIEKLMKKTESKLEKTIEKGEIAKGAVGFKEVRKKSWFERYRWFYTSDEVLAVGGRPPRELSRSALADIIQPRYSELFDLIKAEISRNGFEDKISAGIVFTGGTSKIEGVVELAESIFQTSVRLGVPSKFQGMETILQNPIYSTSIGLIEHGFKQLNNEMLSEHSQGFFSKLLRIVKSEY